MTLHRTPNLTDDTLLAKPGEVENGIIKAFELDRHLFSRTNPLLRLLLLIACRREVAHDLKASAEIPRTKREDFFIVRIFTSFLILC